MFVAEVSQKLSKVKPSPREICICLQTSRRLRPYEKTRNRVGFCGKRANYIGNKVLMEQSRIKRKITNQSLWATKPPTPSRTCRWRAAATPPHMPWIRRSPSADGKSSNLGSEEPPPCCAVAVVLFTNTSPLRLFINRSRRTAVSGKGKPHPRDPKNSRRDEGRQPTVEVAHRRI